MIIYTDGASRGNPGPAAAGYVVDGMPYGKKLGKQTNNYAEYMAIVLGLEKAKEILEKKSSEAEIEVRMDSELATRQLNGLYKVKNAGIKPLFERVKKLAEEFQGVKFSHVPREENQAADKAANDALDGLV